MALKQTLQKPAPPKPVLKKAAAPATTDAAATPSIFLRVDAVEVLEGFVTDLDRAAERAELAVREGRPRDALLAAGDMQSLMRAWKDRLADALSQTRSKRVAPAVRDAARDAARQVLPALAARMRVMEAQIKVHRVRQEAIGAALRAASTAPVGVYGASLRYGARTAVHVPTRTTGHAFAVTV